MKISELFETALAINDPAIPSHRDAAYVKKTSGLKVGTTALPGSGIFIGDWARITKGEHEGSFGYIMSKGEAGDQIPGNVPGAMVTARTFDIDISRSGEPEKVNVERRQFSIKKSWKDIPHLVDTVGGAVSAKIKADKEKVSAKADSTEMSTSTPSSVYGDSTAQPNMNFPTHNQALYINTTKYRTPEEKQITKDALTKLEADLKIHKAFVEANPEPNAKDRQQTLKNAERIVDMFRKVSGIVDDYTGLIKMLNTTVNSGERDLFDDAAKELSALIFSMRDERRMAKIKQTLPKYAGRARTLVAIAIENMAQEEKTVKEWARKRDWSKDKLDASKKTSERMRLAWVE